MCTKHRHFLLSTLLCWFLSGKYCAEDILFFLGHTILKKILFLPFPTQKMTSTLLYRVVFRSETSLCMRSFTRKSVHFCAILICGRAMDEKRKKNTQKVSFLNHWFSSEFRSVISLSYWSLMNYAFLPLLLQYIELCFALLFVLKVWKGTREDVEVPKERRKVFMATRKTWMSGPYVLSRLRWVIKKGDGDSLSFFNDYVQPLVPVHT